MTESLFPPPAPSAPAAGFFTAHCDGGSRGNPGPAGYGAVIEDPSGQIVARLSQYLGRRTNNYAEYQGLLAVLAWAAENRVTHLRVISDSELMVRQMSGRYKVSSPALLPLWQEARRRADALERFEMRHTLRGGNKEADRLANEAMDLGTSKSGPESRPNTAPNTSPRPSGPSRGPSPRPAKILEGYVKNGVVHLLDGELPDGAFVKILLE
ncbi:MAG TPA: ribonuclease HI family protein [Terracidiphilus sp.]|nr:ribonuclease HI family protein [Terracidiphilus sp.]